MCFLGFNPDVLLIGVDIHLPYLQALKHICQAYHLVLCDGSHLPFRQKCIDLVVCIEVIEHLNKRDGKKMLHDFDEIARRVLILTTPNGFKKSRHRSRPLLHKSGWTVKELRKHGYHVRGVGTKLGRKLPTKIALMLDYFFTPLSWKIPQLADRLIAVKEMKHDE